MKTGTIVPVFLNALTLAVERLIHVILTIANVHRNFEAKTHFGNFWFGPHDQAPYKIKFNN